MTATIKFILARKKSDFQTTDLSEVSSLYRVTTNIFIFSHIGLLGLAIILSAFNIISFVTLTYSIAILETFFGAFIGIIINDIFRTDQTSQV